MPDPESNESPSLTRPFYRAGVAGLTTALKLSQTARYKITVAAEHMPGDYDIRYASPWAGANYLPLVKLPPTGIFIQVFLFYSLIHIGIVIEIEIVL